MHDPEDSSSHGHRVGEDTFPLWENQVGRDALRPAFASFRD